ncbi:MAG: phosphatase PAP2 family protein [Saprospiraceae bacterium]|nr:phosphatase PAP2 family protein [Saprospiraceae bacterium]
MKNFKIILLTFVSFILIFNACEEDFPNYIEYNSYSWSGLDITAGDWRPVLLNSNEQIVIPQPTDIQSDAYKAELAQLKSTVASLTGAQREAINYWTNNPIIRWNEISRELAAKYNLTPAPNADGTYPGPNPATPDKYPLFPFSHPPYSCRAFAYLAVSQFDALISGWHYKYKFNRPAISSTDASIPQAFPTNALPSYPSDAAIVASVSQAILTALFPLEKSYLEERANEARNVALWSGVNVQSDIDAGKILGEEVAKISLARAKTDGMSAAQTPKPISDSIKQLAFNTFGWSWTNQETPIRPVGITPLFGKVKTWAVADVTAIRPPVPPKPGSAEFEVAAKELRDISENLTSEQRKIANWWADGLNTYTPPGHWNRFACDQLIESQVNPVRSARTLAYLNMGIMDAGIACWDSKYYYHYPRPIEVISGYKTILGTPNFPSYTSGHATFSSAASEILSYLYPVSAAKFNNYAIEASDSRIYAGIHFRFDATEGLIQGKKVAAAVIDIAKVDGAN